jgi:hypothetical protein
MTGGTYRVDPDETPSEAVVRALAAEMDRAAGEIPTLYESVDPDALDVLFRDRRGGRVEFEHVGYRITVCSEGEVRLEATA